MALKNFLFKTKERYETFTQCAHQKKGSQHPKGWGVGMGLEGEGFLCINYFRQSSNINNTRTIPSAVTTVITVTYVYDSVASGPFRRWKKLCSFNGLLYLFYPPININLQSVLVFGSLVCFFLRLFVSMYITILGKIY